MKQNAKCVDNSAYIRTMTSGLVNEKQMENFGGEILTTNYLSSGNLP